MISLITGVPGSGKTCLLVSMLLQNDPPSSKLRDLLVKLRLKRPAERRPVYQHGINGLLLPHVKVFCDVEGCRWCSESDKPEGYLKVQDWHQWAKAGDLIVIDECQFAFPTRSVSSAVPTYVSQLSTHRHLGFDFILLTQDSKFLDTFARKLITKHQHIAGRFVGALVYEWSHCQGNIDRTEGAVERPYKPNKKAFGFYSSAELHTKVRKAVPLSLYVGVAALLGLLYVGYGFLSDFYVKRRVDSEEAERRAATGAAAAAPVRQGEAVARSSIALPLEAAHPFSGWEVTVAGVSRILGRRDALLRFSRAGFEPVEIKASDLASSGYSVLVRGLCDSEVYFEGNKLTSNCWRVRVSDNGGNVEQVFDGV